MAAVASPIERFWRYVHKTETCWLWTGAVGSHGYGNFAVDGRRASPKTVRAHKFAYEAVLGPVPAGLELDHLCRVRNCVNPDHMEPVTRRENLVRGIGFPAVNAKKAHCPQGHEYTYSAAQGGRICLTCRRARCRLAYQRRKVV